MDERARSCLLRHRLKLEQDIKPSFIMDHMVGDGVISPDEEEKVKSWHTRKEQAVALIDCILKKDNIAYISFYNGLIQEQYRDLAALLQHDLPLVSPPIQKGFSHDETAYVQTILCEGGVPQRPVVFVHRPEQIKKIRDQLCKLEKHSGWVTIFGMAGFGKSVLAAESVRDEQLLRAYFPGGVHWLSIGQLDKADLLAKMQALCFRLDQESQTFQRPLVTTEEARDRLRFIMVRRYPRSLLILDDVWDSWVLKAFDIQCRVLLTTRDRSVTDSVSGKKYEVSVRNGLEEDKSLEVLALFVNKKVKELPEQAYSIVKECKGSPLVISLIGALLREFPDRWEYYLRQLQNKQFKRIRKSSSYDYEALDQAMSVSIEVLPEHYKEYYMDLTVLEKDVHFPAKVLSVLWDLEPEEVEDILQEFVNKSLLFLDRNKTPFQYYLHDLQLDFLTEQNRSRIQELHSNVVTQYKKHYKNEHSNVADEEGVYWFRYLGYHFAKAYMKKELCSLLFSLDWVKAKSEKMGSAHLINDYVIHKEMLDEENSVIRDDFQAFISLNGPLLEQKPFPDIIQLGLSQPDSSEVYRQARTKALEKAKQGSFYLEWINKTSLENLSRLIIRPHTGAVYYACFSRDLKKIASCGADKTLQVFKSETGENLFGFTAHTDDVLCCAFCPDEKLIATCSADKMVKIWNAVTGNLIRTYEEHSEQVNHCQFTNTNRKVLLATCSNDSDLKLWNINRPHSQNTLFGHDDYVNHCCFSPDDEYLASCSSDGTLKLWQVSAANEWKTIDIKEYFPINEGDNNIIVKCSAWSSDGTRIMTAARNQIFVFAVETSCLLSNIKTSHHSTIQFCDFCPSSQLVALALSHCTVELWDINSNKKVADCPGHLSWVHCVRFSQDGSMLLSSSDDQTVRVWETNKVHTSSAAFLKRDANVIFQNNNPTVLAPDSKKRLQMITGKTGERVHFSDEQESRIRCCCLNNNLQTSALGQDNGTVKASLMSPTQVLRSIGWWTLHLLTLQETILAALGLENGNVKVLEMPSGQIRSILEGHTKAVQHCQFICESELLVTCSDDATIRIWNWKSKDSMVLVGHTEQVKEFRVLDGSKLLSWSFDGTVKLWDIETGKIIQDFICHKGAVLACDILLDGNKFCSGSADKSAKIWNFSTTSALQVLNGHEACVRSCRFSWDGTVLATGDDNGEIRIWHVFDGQLLHICTRDSKDSFESLHGGWVTDLHFSPNCKVLVSTGGYIKWWNVENGESLQTFYTTGSNLKGIHVSADFKTFVTIDNMGILYVLKKLE